MALPGVKVGPLDPDASEGFGRVGGSEAETNARQLIRLHNALFPAQHRQVFARPRDTERSEALDHEELASALADDLPEGVTLVGAAVRGERDRPQVLTFQYRAPSGRVGKAFVDYTADRFPSSVARGDKAVEVARVRREELPWDHGALQVESLRRENAELRSQVERLARERQEATGAPPARDPEPANPAGLAEPVEGYDRLKADEIVELVKSGETSDEELRAILDYERSGANRKTVVSALEQQLGAGDPALTGDTPGA